MKKFITLALLLVSSQSHAATYYVSTADGNDTNCTGLATTAYVSGTAQACPWKTITKVNAATFVAGDNILFKRGESWTAAVSLNPRQSGTSGNVITYGAYGSGINPLLAPTSGRGVDIRACSYNTITDIDVITVAQSAYWFNTNVDHFTVQNSTISGGSYAFNFFSGNHDNITINNVTSTVSTDGILVDAASVLTNSSVTNSTFTGSAKGLNFNNATSNAITINNSKFNANTTGMSLFGIDGLSIIGGEIKNNTASGFNATKVSTNTLTNVSLSGVTITGNASYGINLSAPSSTVSINNCTVNGNGNTGPVPNMNVAETSTGMTITNSTFNSGGGAGVSMVAGTTATFTGCDFSDNGFSAVNAGTGISVGGTAVVTINNSTAYRNGDDGMDATGNANLTLDHCIADYNGFNGLGGLGNGYSWHLASTGIIRYSRAWGNKINAIAHIDTSSVNMYYNVFGHDTTGSLPLVYLQGTTHTLSNNTLISKGQIGTGIQVLSGTTAIIKNNLIYGFDIGIQKDVGSTMTEDYNSVLNIKTTPYSGLSAGAHDTPTTLTPVFLSLSGNNFALRNNILAGKGVNLSLTTDYLGRPAKNPPSIGAYEFYPSGGGGNFGDNGFFSF